MNVFLVLMEMASIAQVSKGDINQNISSISLLPDIDECADSNINNCSDNANCTDTVGSYECTCLEGYTGDGFMCLDIDECSNSTEYPCHPNAHCNNTLGSFICYCMVGYTGDGMTCDGRT